MTNGIGDKPCHMLIPSKVSRASVVACAFVFSFSSSFCKIWTFCGFILGLKNSSWYFLVLHCCVHEKIGGRLVWYKKEPLTFVLVWLPTLEVGGGISGRGQVNVLL